MPTLLLIQKSHLFWKKLGDDVKLVQCPFKFVYSCIEIGQCASQVVDSSRCAGLVLLIS